MVPKPQIIGKYEMHSPASLSSSTSLLLYFLCFSLDNSQLFFNLYEKTRKTYLLILNQLLLFLVYFLLGP